MFNSLKDGFRQYINEATWMNDQATKTIAKQKIDALTAAIGYASIASDDARLDSYYEKVSIYSNKTIIVFEIQRKNNYI
jgi:predicted metalloendopeptidase